MVYGLLAPLKQKYNTTLLTHRTTVKVVIGQVIEDSRALCMVSGQREILIVYMLIR